MESYKYIKRHFSIAGADSKTQWYILQDTLPSLGLIIG